MVNCVHLETILRQSGEAYHILPLQGEAAALITQRGGRVLGLFPSRNADNLFWVNHVPLADAASFQQFVAEDNWNLGGERIWIAPEIQYNVRDRYDFWGTLRVPPQVDPAAYTLQADAADGMSRVWLKTAFELETYNLAVGRQALTLLRCLKPIPNPLEALPAYAALAARVVYCGYEHHVQLEARQPGISSAAWSLVQVNAGGQLIIPCLPALEASDYFGNVPPAARQVLQDDGSVPHVRLHLTGKQQYKLGYKAFSMVGRMGYYHTLPDGRDYLLIRSFFNNPSNSYTEEPPHLPGVNGHSVHVYNDGGEFGGETSFGEMEATGQTVGIAAQDAAHDCFTLWVYVGSPEAIRMVAYWLLGVRL